MGILIPLLIGIVLFFILYFYSRLTTPGQDIFLSKSLYSLAVIVMSSFLITLSTLFFSLHKFYFSKSHVEKDPKSLLYQIQYPLRIRKYKLIFICTSIAYFVFFGFLSNIFIYFIDNTTIFSLVPLPSSTHRTTQGVQLDNASTSNNHGNNNLKSSNQTLYQQYQNLQHGEGTNHQTTATQSQNFAGTVPSKDYPNSQLIICCNTIGYVPMLIIKLTEHFSILIIPLNLIIATILSALVGLNISLNIFMLSKKKTIKLSKKNFFGVLGISTGLFVGCPTCTGSLFYSLVGFSSFFLFASLNFYQTIFVVITIPMLFLSLLMMMRMLQKSYIDSCRLEKKIKE